MSTCGAPRPGYDAAGLPLDRMARLSFALGMEVEALEPILRRLRDLGFAIVPRDHGVDLLDPEPRDAPWQP